MTGARQTGFAGVVAQPVQPAIRPRGSAVDNPRFVC